MKQERVCSLKDHLVVVLLLICSALQLPLCCLLSRFLLPACDWSTLPANASHWSISGQVVDYASSGCPYNQCQSSLPTLNTTRPRLGAFPPLGLSPLDVQSCRTDPPALQDPRAAYLPSSSTWRRTGLTSDAPSTPTSKLPSSPSTVGQAS